MLIEQEIILDVCVRNKTSDVESSLLKLKDHSWLKIYSLLRRHKLLSLFYSEINKDGLTGFVPEKLLTSMKKDYQYHTARNEELIDTFIQLVKYGNKHDSAIYPFKGIYLLLTIYKENVGIRPTNDVDLYTTLKLDYFFEEHNFFQGTFKNQEVQVASRKQKLFYSLFLHQVPEFYKEWKWDEKETYIIFEPHKNLGILDPSGNQWIGVSLSEMGSRANSIQYEDVFIHCFDVADQIICLLYHVYIDYISKAELTISRLLDIILIIKTHNINWDEIKYRM